MHSGGGSHFRKYDELDDKVDKYTKLGSKEVHNNLIKICVKNNFVSLSYYFTRDEALFCGLFFITDTLHIPTIFTHLCLLPVVCRTSSTIILE